MWTKYFITVLLNWETNKWFLFVIVSFLYSFQINTNLKKKQRAKLHCIVIVNIKITHNSFCFENSQHCPQPCTATESLCHFMSRIVLYLGTRYDILTKGQGHTTRSKVTKNELMVICRKHITLTDIIPGTKVQYNKRHLMT